MKTLLVAALLVASPAFAADFTCKGDRVEKSGSTQFQVRTQGSDYTIEKGGSTKGKAVRRGGKYYVEVGGSTVATIENGKIEKGGSSWGSVDEARRTFDCPDLVAATLWVLMKNGNL